MTKAHGLLAMTLAVSLLSIPIRSGHALEDAPPVRTIAGSEPGVHADILSLKRTEGGLLTLRIAFANETGGEIKNKAFPGGGAVERIALFDFAHKRKYPVLFTSDGACLCTTLNPFTASAPGTRVLWAKFPAPPASVTRVSLMFPDDEPVDDVPIG
jgi:hypothetical protein